MRVSTLTTKGQVTIPNEIRQRLNLHPGDQVGFVIENDHVILFRKIKDVRAAFGIVRAKRGVSLEQMEEAIRKRGKHDSD